MRFSGHGLGAFATVAASWAVQRFGSVRFGSVRFIWSGYYNEETLDGRTGPLTSRPNMNFHRKSFGFGRIYLFVCFYFWYDEIL